MSTFYDTSNNTGYLLYTYSNHIIIRSKKDNMFSKGQVLTSDFLQDLSDTQFNSSIYYSYIDLYNNLIIRRLFDSSILFMSESITYTYFMPRLISFSGKLIILVEKKYDNKRYINAIFPFLPNFVLKINQPIDENTKIDIYAGEKYLYICLFNNTFSNIYLIDHNFNIHQLSDLNLEIKYQSIIKEKEQEIYKLNKVIESAKIQYEELMEVAKKYREEALKWSNKFD
ncbi:MAG: hypothetical protein SOW32_00315 [Agathobacter sp.]|nr:hypothetical protein [Agathobacter sp.]MDY3795579.1 hypothetical protein [Agathobacter sp.]